MVRQSGETNSDPDPPDVPHGADDRASAAALLPLVYDELRKLAAARLSRENPGQTMQATVLVHEVYLRLADVRLPASFAGRKHFFAAAAEAMRRILIERARRKMGPTRGGRRKRVDLDGAWELAEESATFDVLALDEALERLALAAPAKAELVKLRFFAGLSMSDAADLLGISLATAERHWVFARTWLYAELQEEDGGPSKKKSEGP